MGQLDAGVIDGVKQLHDRMNTSVSHGLGKVEDDLKGVQQRAIPVLLQDAPNSLNRIVLAVIGGIVG